MWNMTNITAENTPSTSTSSNDMYAGAAFIPRAGRLLNFVFTGGFSFVVAPPPASAVDCADNSTPRSSTLATTVDDGFVSAVLPVEEAEGSEPAAFPATPPAGAKLDVRCPAVHTWDADGVGAELGVLMIFDAPHMRRMTS